jgi:flagellar motor protein MotB
MRAIGRGEFEPRADNGTEGGRQLNRRVEILVQTTA